MGRSNRTKPRFGRAAAAAAAVALAASAPAASAGVLAVNKGQTCWPADPPSSCRPGLWAVQDDGGGARQITRPEQTRWSGDTSPSWSPDGRQLVFDWFDNQANDGGLIISEAAGGARRRLLAPGVVSSGRYRADDQSPDWSPRGDWIAFSSARADGAGLPDFPGADDVDVFVIRPDGTGLRRVAGGSGDETTPEFSPDGSRLSFFRAGGGPGGPVPGTGSDTGNYSVDLDGGDERRLTVGAALRTSFSPSGRFATYKTATGQLWTMRSDGSDVRSWTDARAFVMPRVAWSSGDALFYGGPAPGAPPQSGITAVPYAVYRLDLASSNPRPRALIDGSDMDWTGGPGAKLPSLRDRTPPAALLLGSERSPLARTAQRRERRIPSVDRDRLGFLASDPGGVRRVDAAIARRSGRRCRFRVGSRWTKPRSCSGPLFRRVSGLPSWKRRLRPLRRGTYLIALRATDVRRNRTRRPALRSIRLR